VVTGEVIDQDGPLFKHFRVLAAESAARDGRRGVGEADPGQP
jgi:hypothetical protein